MERVLRGERLVVTRHGAPVATLQPFTGVVLDRVTGRATDIVGSPLGDCADEVAKLSEIQKRLLVDGARFDRIVPTRLWRDDFGTVIRELTRLGMRGLARKTRRGWVFTGRGLMLREYLLAQAGAPEESTWRLRRGQTSFDLGDGSP